MINIPEQKVMRFVKDSVVFLKDDYAQWDGRIVVCDVDQANWLQKNTRDANGDLLFYTDVPPVAIDYTDPLWPASYIYFEDWIVASTYGRIQKGAEIIQVIK